MYDLHLLGWNSFQQLCLTITREVLGQTVQSFLDANDAGRDGAFAGSWTPSSGEHLSGKFVIQCKFSNRPTFYLTKSGIADEIPKVRKLVADGFCDVYILMTNAGVSANQESLIKSELLGAGAKHVLILGFTWIEDQIKENTRLRMLVPRIYGLGDLSQILDERAYAQARAVLESLREDLAKVVVTDSYRKAVDALDEHGFVLLIGEPAAGKTTIASMLAMAAADKWGSSVLKLADPGKVVEHWNVEEPTQFFWIDDAFGVTQYESPLVHGWNHSLVQIKAMLRQGVKIVMTSRDYIYNRARHDLKESTFPLINESQVVIDVHDLSDLEKQQILYNHLKLGKQPVAFCTSVKPYLEFIAAHSRFIPETARRIADPLFTKNLYLSEYHLGQFVDKREQLLLEVIQGLDVNDKAALGLIYMRKDHLESPITLQNSEPQALERLGRIDILINNAGIIRRNDAVEFTEDDWDAVMDVNLKALFFTTQAFAKAVLTRGGQGAVVNIASLLSFQGGIRVPSYTASKHGVAGLTKLLVNEWAAQGINVNAVAPGYIETNNTQALRADPARNQSILDRIPAGHWGNPSDIAGAAVYLCTPAAAYVHGAVLNVDGGWLAR